MDHSSEESTLLMDEGYLRFLGGSRSQEDARLEVEIRAYGTSHEATSSQ